MDDQIPEKGSMPQIRVSLEQLLCFLEGEKVKHEGAERSGGRERSIQESCITGREDGVCAVGEFRDAVYNLVAERFDAEAVGEDVEVQEGVVGRFSVFEGERRDVRGIEPGCEEGEDGGIEVGEGEGLGGGFEEGAGERGAEVGRCRG
jgi:hypothetical protein